MKRRVPKGSNVQMESIEAIAKKKQRITLKKKNYSEFQNKPEIDSSIEIQE